MINKNQDARDGASTGSTNGGSPSVAGTDDPISRLCAAAAPATLAGSLLAAPAAERAAYAARIAAAGAWVHLDLIDDAYPLGAGVSSDLLAELADLRDRLDVHLLVSDPASTLEEVLDHRPARVTIQVENVPDPRGPYLATAARACAEVGTDLWVGIAPRTPLDVVDEVRASVEGVLVMLAEPGRAGTVAQPAMVSRAAALRHLPCGVDGGVTEQGFADLNSAGVNHIVMGRRLWSLAGAHSATHGETRTPASGPTPMTTTRGRGASDDHPTQS